VFFEKPDAATDKKIRSFIILFGSNAPDDRERARDGLFEIGYWSVRPLLDALTARDDRSVNARCNAVLVLGRLEQALEDVRALPALRAAVVSDGSENPAAFAALVLGRLRDGEALGPFRDALAERKRESLKTAVLVALGRLARVRGDEAATLLEQAVDRRTSVPLQREAAMLALGLFPRRVAVVSADGAGEVPAPRVRGALEDGSAGMRLSAVLALALSRRDDFYDVFLRVYRDDSDRQVRRAALLALARRRDPATTDVLGDALESTGAGIEVRRMAAYLLAARRDPAALKRLIGVATAASKPELAAAAVVALGGIPEDRAVSLVLGKLDDRSATVRAAAAVGATRFPRTADLLRAVDRLNERLRAGEQDEAARADMTLSRRIVEHELDDRALEAAGQPRRPPLPPQPWTEADAEDLLGLLGRDETQALLDLVNLRVRQVLGVEGLPAYRSPDATLISGKDRIQREHAVYSDERDLLRELQRRPYYTLEDLPDWARPPIPREGR